MSVLSRLSAPMTLRELAVEIGWPEPHRVSSLARLRRRIVRRERELGVTLYHCAGARSSGYVTRAELLGWMPELRDTKSEIESRLREMLGDLREKVAELDHQVRGLSGLVGKRVGAVEGRLGRLEARG